MFEVQPLPDERRVALQLGTVLLSKTVVVAPPCVVSVLPFRPLIFLPLFDPSMHGKVGAPFNSGVKKGRLSLNEFAEACGVSWGITKRWYRGWTSSQQLKNGHQTCQLENEVESKSKEATCDYREHNGP